MMKSKKLIIEIIIITVSFLIFYLNFLFTTSPLPSVMVLLLFRGVESFSYCTLSPPFQRRGLPAKAGRGWLL
jgi:hypothetical protein